MNVQKLFLMVAVGALSVCQALASNVTISPASVKLYPKTPVKMTITNTQPQGPGVQHMALSNSSNVKVIDGDCADIAAGHSCTLTLGLTETASLSKETL